MTLIIENANDAILRVVESLKGLNSDLKITAENECEICRAHDYTPNKKTIKLIKKSMKEFEKERKKGTLKTYNNMEDLRKALEA